MVRTRSPGLSRPLVTDRAGGASYEKIYYVYELLLYGTLQLTANLSCMSVLHSICRAHSCWGLRA